MISSIDNKSKVGPIDKINKLVDSAKMKGNQVGTVTEIDVNEKIIETQFHIDLKAFISDSSKRLTAKMAYEWFCYVSSNSNNKDIVTYVSDNRVSELFKQHTSHGSHTFMAYETDKSINVLISFFGICIYNVRLLNRLVPKYTENCFLHEFQLSAKRSILDQQSRNDFYQLIDKGLEVVQTINGPALAPKEEYRKGYNWGAIGLYYNIELIINEIEFLEEENEALVNLVIEKLVEVIRSFVKCGGST